MCTDIMACHGDSPIPNAYNEKQAKQKKVMVERSGDHCKPAMFYITRDGQYAVDADFVSAADLVNPDFDISSIPKVRIMKD